MAKPVKDGKPLSPGLGAGVELFGDLFIRNRDIFVIEHNIFLNTSYLNLKL